MKTASDIAATPTAATMPASPPRANPLAPRPTILLLEDDKLTADAMTQLLDHYGYDVHATTNILDTMSVLTLVPKFAVLDLMLPDGGGERILELIRRRKMTTRVAVVTACRDRDRLTEVVRLKPDCILSKPLDFLKLLEFLRTA